MKVCDQMVVFATCIVRVTCRVPEPVQDPTSGAVKGFSHGKHLSLLLMYSQWRGDRQRGGAAFCQAVPQRAHSHETVTSMLVERTHAYAEIVIDRWIDENHNKM